MTQQRGRGLGGQPVPPHKIKADSTLQQRVDQMIKNADNFGGKPKTTGYENASKDNYMHYPKDGSPPRVLGPRKSNAGPRTSTQFDKDRREAQAHADSVMKGKRKN